MAVSGGRPGVMGIMEGWVVAGGSCAGGGGEGAKGAGGAREGRVAGVREVRPVCGAGVGTPTGRPLGTQSHCLKPRGTDATRLHGGKDLASGGRSTRVDAPVAVLKTASGLPRPSGTTKMPLRAPFHLTPMTLTSVPITGAPPAPLRPARASVTPNPGRMSREPFSLPHTPQHPNANARHYHPTSTQWSFHMTTTFRFGRSTRTHFQQSPLSRYVPRLETQRLKRDRRPVTHTHTRAHNPLSHETRRQEI